MATVRMVAWLLLECCSIVFRPDGTKAVLVVVRRDDDGMVPIENGRRHDTNGTANTIWSRRTKHERFMSSDKHIVD